MALNFADLEILRPHLVPRIKEALIKFLLYTQGGGGTPSQQRKDWCTANIPNAESIAQQLSYYCMSEPDFIASGTSISDATISARIEAVVQTYLMPA